MQNFMQIVCFAFALIGVATAAPRLESAEKADTSFHGESVNAENTGPGSWTPPTYYD